MKIEELKQYFVHQTTKTDTYEPTGTVEYWMFHGQNRVLAKAKEADLEKTVLLALDGYAFEGYRDRIPLFVKPDENQG
jgi:hypothetical protein